MASTTIADTEVATHSTLTAATVETVTIDRNASTVRVMNRDGAAEIYYTLDGSAPTVGGATTYALPAAISSEDRPVPSVTSATTVVKMISSGTPKFSVQVLG